MENKIFRIDIESYMDVKGGTAFCCLVHVNGKTYHEFFGYGDLKKFIKKNVFIMCKNKDVQKKFRECL